MKETETTPITQPHDEEVPRSVWIAAITSLETLVLHQPTVVEELFLLASEGTIPSAKSATILKGYALMEENGKLHESIKLIVTEIVTHDNGKLVINNIKKEDAPISDEVNSAVNTLEKNELVAINLCISLGNFGERTQGYEKIARFVQNGQPSNELKTAIRVALAKKSA